MQNLPVFGYGSLVNRETHEFVRTRPARLDGWRRVWVFTVLRPVAYLSVEPADVAIDGILAEVPDDERAALDQREAAYERLPVGVRLHEDGYGAPAEVYAIPARHIVGAGADHCLVLSYIDTVAMGFHDLFGMPGVRRFFASTSGWQAPVVDDRAAPRYARACRLPPDLRGCVDVHLAALSVRIVRA